MTTTPPYDPISTTLYPIIDEIQKRLNTKQTHQIHLGLRVSYTSPLKYYISCTKSDTKNNKTTHATLTDIKLENNQITIPTNHCKQTETDDRHYPLSDPQIITKLTTTIAELIQNSDILNT